MVKGRKALGNNAALRPQVVKGRAAFYTTLSSGSFSTPWTPNQVTRLINISDNYQLYRWKKLKFTITEGSWGASILAGKFSTGYAFGVYHEVPDTLPTTDHTKLLEEPNSIFMDGSWAAAQSASPTGYQGPLQCGYNPRSLFMNTSNCLGSAPYKWWRTRAASGSSSDTWQQNQFTLCFVAEDTTLGSGLQFTWRCDYEIEFSDPVDPSQTPAPLLKNVDDVSSLSDTVKRQLLIKLASSRVDSSDVTPGE